MRAIVDTAGERLDVFLARTQPGYSRSFWQHLCEQGQVTLNGTTTKTSTKLKQGDTVEVTLPAVADFSNHTLPVLYEDNDVLVLNKPAGILTHAKGALNHEFSVAEFMRSRSTDQPTGNRPGIVHRLDRGTSGVIIAAKTTAAKHWLQKQFATRKAKKTYLALVEGRPKEPAAIIRLPIERNPKKPQTFRVGPSGKPAETEYATEQAYPNHTLLRLKPTTGRTHQLRVHLAYLGHPIVGDHLYGTANPALGRLFLHAAELEITLPNRQRKTFTAPMPPELHAFLSNLHG